MLSFITEQHLLIQIIASINSKDEYFIAVVVKVIYFIDIIVIDEFINFINLLIKSIAKLDSK